MALAPGSSGQTRKGSWQGRKMLAKGPNYPAQRPYAHLTSWTSRLPTKIVYITTAFVSRRPPYRSTSIRISVLLASRLEGAQSTGIAETVIYRLGSSFISVASFGMYRTSHTLGRHFPVIAAQRITIDTWRTF